jgi:glucosyl-dolichyl phosphate glucuronosyltransferase
MIRFSIIVPTLDRAGILAQCLESVAALDFERPGFEVLVVDNGSSDRTPEIVRQFMDLHPELVLRFIVEKEPGLLSGRHRGVREAIGDILAFIDDDTLVDPGWLRAIDAGFSNSEVIIVGGPSLPKYQSPPPPWLEWFWETDQEKSVCGALSLIDFGPKERRVPASWVFGLNFSIRKGALLELGGFHPDCIPVQFQKFQGDGETGLARKAEAQGRPAVFSPGAKVHHLIPKERLTIESFAIRFYYQGICDSYFAMRQAGKVPPSSIRKCWERQWRRAIGCAGRLIGEQLKLFVLNTMRQAYLEGYEFHRRAALRDPKVLSWVLRDDYWDYRLP